jgi:leucyl aminopeptidase
MECLFAADIEKRKNADALVLPLWKGKKQGEWAANCQFIVHSIPAVLETGDFKGKEGETLILYVSGQPEKRVILLGLGEKDRLTVETLRRAYGSLVKACLAKHLHSLNVVIPHHTSLSESGFLKGMAEGLLLPNYAFEKYKSAAEEKEGSLLTKVTFLGCHGGHQEVVKTQAVCEAVYYARDLVNGNADEITPQYLAECAKQLGKEHEGLKVTVFDKKRIEKEKWDLLLAVNRGSALDPVVLILEYKGNPKSKDLTVLVGKGITYDTGGLNIKSSGMETMKCDMGGAATCLGVIKALCALKLKTNVIAIIPSTENGVDARSFKPGDVYSSYSGKTVEMTNSDAEGRLILADALAYAVEKWKPTRLIDFATLTGAMEISLGAEATGLMSTNEELAEALERAGEETFERVWRMPLFEEYKEKLKSDIADLKSWNGRSASSCVAATFLRQFVGNTPWAHLDIASTAFLSEPKKYIPKYATGVGIRLMIEFLENL